MATRVSKEPSIENPEEVYENFLQKSLGTKCRGGGQ